MSSRKKTDFLIEQTIFLGGQVSHKYTVFKDISRMSPDYAEMYLLLKKIENLDKEPNTLKLVSDLIELLGEVDFVRNCSELTKLSMILGDTRARYSAKGVMDELRKTRSDSPT